MRINHFLFPLALAVAPMLCAAGPSRPVGEIQNASAELANADNTPVAWVLEPVPRGNALPGGKLVSEMAHAGAKSLMISAPGTFWTNKTLVRPYASYKLSGWIRTENVAAASERGASIQVRGVKVTSTGQRVGGAQDWTCVEIAFDTEGQDSLVLAAGIGGSRSRGAQDPLTVGQGKAWFDDFRLELVSARELKPAVAIDVSKTRAPMPDLVYGQFIEHLGRCIYGGIWAEMLGDRKFYSAVGETRRDKVFVPSPWKAVGTPASVAMARENPYVGEHTPVVELDGASPHGITQSGLGVVAGKGYVGYVILAGDATSGPVEVSLSWGEGVAGRQTVRIEKVLPEYRKFPLKFKAAASSDDAVFEIVGKGKGKLRIGPPSLMPDDNIRGMRRDTLALLRQLDSPIYRWPGGNFVSGYNWKDGIGERDRRPPRKNPAWTGIEHNDFGMHEYFDFLKELKSQPFIALNAGLGSVDSAVEEVQYVNGGAGTPMGKLRAQNGHPEPFGCTYWAVGNEMSGSWQLGNVPIDEFIRRHNAFSKALLDADKGIKLVASGEAVRPSSDWDRKLLAGSADYLHLNSKHFYKQDWHGGGLLTHVRQIGDAIRAIADGHREYLKTIPEIGGKDIKVSLDEWNYWYGPHVFGELGTRYFLRDALGIAGGINEYSRNTDVIALACYAQTVNVIGAIKTSKTSAVLDSTGEALVMYRRHFGTVPVEVTGTPEPLDVAASWMPDGKTLAVSVINPTWEAQRLGLRLAGGELQATSGTAWVLAGPDDMAFNDPGKAPVVVVTERAVKNAADALEVAPVSATIFHLHAKRGQATASPKSQH